MIQEVDFKTQMNATVGEDIGFELGAKMVKDFQDQYPTENIGIQVGRNIIESILAQPGCVGMKIYNAIDENGNKTMVFVGLDEQGKHILEYNTVNQRGMLEKKDGIVADRVIIIKPGDPETPPPSNWW
ncbi:MAG TPA: hypothetical protein VIK74_00375 [Parasegetibacter sp.]|jgi:hypothetical protein